MKQIFNVLGMIFVAQLLFVGLVHVFLLLQEKHSVQTLETLHAMPVVGGFFLPPSGEEARELSEAERRRLEAEEALREGEEFFPLPEGFDREELTSMLRTLGDTRRAQERKEQQLAEEREALVAATAALESQREELMKFSERIETRVQELEAKQNELAARRNRIEESEVENLKTIASIYEGMSDPAVAALKLSRQPDDLIARILHQMSPRKRAKIVEMMETTRAVAVTREIEALDLNRKNAGADDN